MINTSYYVINVSPEEIQLTNDVRTITMKGELVSKVINNLVTLMDGTRRINELFDKFPNYSKNFILSLILKFSENGLLDEGEVKTTFSEHEKALYNGQLQLFSHFHNDKYAIHGSLKGAKVVLINLNNIGINISKLLTKTGIGNLTLLDSTEVQKSDVINSELFSNEDVGNSKSKALKNELLNINPDIEILTDTKNFMDTRDYSNFKNKDLVVLSNEKLNMEKYRIINRISLDNDVHWTSCRLDGLIGKIGPTIIPKHTACYNCYEVRMLSNMKYVKEYNNYQKYLNEKSDKDFEFRSYGSSHMFDEMVSNSMSIEIVKYLSRFLPPLTIGKEIMIDFEDMLIQSNSILKLPRCQVCGVRGPKIDPWMR